MRDVYADPLTIEALGDEAACERMGIRLFVLPPRSPKLNGHVDRARRTHQEEFYDLVEVPDPLAEHNALPQEWERTYNTVRLHQTLGYRTPQEHLTQRRIQHHDRGREGSVSHLLDQYVVMTLAGR